MDSASTDIVIVGAGAAGLAAALSVAPRRVLIVAPLGEEASNTSMAQGGIAAALAAPDSVALHLSDTLLAGGGVVEPRMARGILAEAGAAIEFLCSLGVDFDRESHGWQRHLEAGHSLPRVVHAGGDRTGAAVQAALLARARAAPHIDWCGQRAAATLLCGDEGVAGIVAISPEGAPLAIHATETVLCTGGIGQLYARTTNSLHACGDGLAMALAHGVRTAALEYVQFHPTALDCAADPLPLLTEALRGAGATLLADGRAFMAAIDPRGDLAPRDVVARAVYQLNAAGARVELDARTVFAGAGGGDFPAAQALCRRFGINPGTAAIPVSHAAHFHMGGIATDSQGHSSASGLWAAGEVACTGLHGANRLASNSLLEAVVMGRRLGLAIRRTRYRPRPAVSAQRYPAQLAPPLPEDTRRLRALMERAMGPVRDGATLAGALADLKQWRDALAHEELVLRQRLGLAAALMGEALAHRASRGAHWRADYPGPGRGHGVPAMSAVAATGPQPRATLQVS